MFDLAVIGGGPAGYSAALEAVRRNLTAAVFEKDLLGGTCLNRGCVPTKFLSHTARKISDLRTGAEDGVGCPDLRVDFARTHARMREIVASLREGLEAQLLAGGVQIVRGDAVILDKTHIQCAGEIYEARNLLIATGSAPAPRLFPGALTSDELLDLDTVPDRLHILGGGTVAVEFAEIFRQLGSEVTLSIRGDRILRKWDRELADSIARSFRKKGIQINKNVDFAAFEPAPGETVLSAAGRIPRIPETAVPLFDLGETGGIIANASGETKTQGVYAAGDVTEGSLLLAHTAMRQGQRIARRIAGVPDPGDSAAVQCIYLDQEAASVGMTEEEAKAQGIPYAAAKQPMYANARTMISTPERGFVKILAHRENRQILGAQLLCERAGDLISELLLAVNLGLTAEDLLRSVRPHPSYCEAVSEALMVLEDKLNGH